MSTEGQTVEPVNRLFLSQASDEALALGLIDERTLRFVFKLNCLFFDHLALGAADLLGNPVFFRMICEEPDAMSALYRRPSPEEPGVLQPIVYGRCEELDDVAEAMLASDTVFRLENKSDLEKHAQAVLDAAPECLWAREEDLRLTYAENMFNVFDYLNCVGVDAISPHRIGIAEGMFTELVSLIRSSASSGDLRCSQVYRFADRNLPGPVRSTVKLVAEALFQYALSTTQSAALSLADQAEQVVRRAKIQLGAEQNIVPGLAGGNATTQEFRLSLPLEAIAELHIKDLLDIRDEHVFQHARRTLADFRVGRGQIDPLALQSELNECGEVITKYATTAGRQRELVVKEVRTRGHGARLRLIFEAGSGTLPLALSLVFGNAVPLTVTTATAVATFFGSYYVRMQEKGPNTVHPETFRDRQHDYNPVSGTDLGPTDRCT